MLLSCRDWETNLQRGQDNWCTVQKDLDETLLSNSVNVLEWSRIRLKYESNCDETPLSNITELEWIYRDQSEKLTKYK